MDLKLAGRTRDGDRRDAGHRPRDRRGASWPRAPTSPSARARAADVSAAEEALAGVGPRVVGSVVDVGEADAIAAWVASTAETFGGIDIVVSNVSALAIPDTEENWEQSLNVDVMGTVRLVKAAMPHLEASEVPAIVTISSVSGREVDFASGPYGTAKSALIAYTQGLAYQLAAKGIRANTVSPGNTYFSGGVWESIESGNPELFEMAMGLNPTGRMGTPAGDGRRRGVPRQPGVQLHDRVQPADRRRPDPRHPAVARARLDLQPGQHGQHPAVVVDASGRSSLVKMLLMCLATAFSVTNSAAGDRGVGAPLGHQRRAPPARAASAGRAARRGGGP